MWLGTFMHMQRGRVLGAAECGPVADAASEPTRSLEPGQGGTGLVRHGREVVDDEGSITIILGQDGQG